MEASIAVSYLRILHVLKDVKNVGNGVTNAAIDIACAQQELGHTVAIASGGGDYESFLSTKGLHHFLLKKFDGSLFFRIRPIPIKFPRMRAATYLIQSVFRMGSIVRTFKPNVVHCHLAGGMILSWLVKPIGKYLLISHIHNIQERRSIVMRLAHAVIPVSTATSDAMVKLGMPRQKLYVVKNGSVGSPRSAGLDERPPKALKQPAIVTVAGMNKRKNIDGLISAFEIVAAEFPTAHLYLVGGGGYHRELFEQQASQSLAADRIHFEGFQTDPQSYMRSAYVFVLPSHRDAFGMVLHEAREAGTAIIATDVDGIPEALDGGRAGVLVPPGNIVALADALRKMLSDPIERQRWKEQAAIGLSQHTTLRMGQEVLSVYQRLLGKAI